MQQSLFFNRCPHCTGLLQSRVTPPGSHRSAIAECCQCGARGTGETFELARESMQDKANSLSFTTGKLLKIIFERSVLIFEHKIKLCKDAGFVFKMPRKKYRLSKGVYNHAAVMARR